MEHHQETTTLISKQVNVQKDKNYVQVQFSDTCG